MSEHEKETRQRLLEAALRELARAGYRGATTRRIAEGAGVAELTLFRHFRTKGELLRAAIASFRPAIRVPVPSDDVVADLRSLLGAYVALTEEERELLLGLLAEILRHPELLPDGPPPGIAGAMAEVIGLFRHHQMAGRLRADEPAEELALAFVGPLMARFLLRNVVGVAFPFDPEAYVRGFLSGRSGGSAEPSHRAS